MVSFQLPVASEIIDVLNFLWSDIILIAVVMFLTSRAAGMLNFKQLMKREPMNLKPFDLPHIGGGMVMTSSWKRNFIALLRVSAIVSVCIGNFGLQGRSELSSKVASVRIPGRVEGFDTRLLANVTETRIRCAKPEGNQVVFGSVIDDHCYLGRHAHVFIRRMSLDFVSVTREIVFRRCVLEKFREKFYSILRCDGIDLSCPGPFLNSPDRDDIDARLCASVIYDGDTSYFCPVPGFNPLLQGSQTADCRTIDARKDDIDYWPLLFRSKTDDLLVAIFGSAYALETRMETDFAGELRSVTIFTSWWIIPAIWQVFLVTGLLIWFFRLRKIGAKAYGNDERSLLGLLRGISEVTDDGIASTDGINRI